MKDVLMFILSFVGSMAVGIGGFYGKQIAERLTSILDELKKLTGISIQHDERIKTLESSRHDHEGRLREIEKKTY